MQRPEICLGYCKPRVTRVNSMEEIRLNDGLGRKNFECHAFIGRQSETMNDFAQRSPTPSNYIIINWGKLLA